MNTIRSWMDRPSAADATSIVQDATRSEDRANNMVLLVRKRAEGRLAPLMAATSVLLSACTLPGMHMDRAPVIPLTSTGSQEVSDWLAGSPGDTPLALPESGVRIGTPIGNAPL